MPDHSAQRKQPRTVTPSKIADAVRYNAELSGQKKPCVTFLLGAGFSRSAGIKTAGEMVGEYLKPHELLKDAGSRPPGISEYAYYMGLLEPSERTRIIKKCIEPAIDPNSKRTRINWAHLLLASMVDAGYVKRILTTNFDPLIVDAFALTGQPVRTFDLTSSNQYISGVLEPGSVVYLHGQAWGLLMTNTSDETDVVRKHLPAVLHEALSDSMLIVVGYSGACDPVLKELAERIPVFTHRMYWVHYGSGEPEGDVREILEDYRREAYLVPDYDADTFMRALVLEGLKVELLPLVRDPLDSILGSLRRIMPFPIRSDEVATDPVVTARESVDAAIQCIAKGEAQSETDFTRKYGSLALEIAMAGATENLARLDELRPRVEAIGDEALRKKLGDACLQVASTKAQSGDYSEALELLTRCEGLDFTEPAWVPLIWGDILSDQAKTKEGEEADRLFAEAYEKYEAALKIKGDKHEALYNWGNALFGQAKTKEGEEADRLFGEACRRYEAALKIKGDLHEALNNWGSALSAQAKTKEGEEADRLLGEACRRYEAALKIKGEKHEALHNWGITLFEQAKTKKGEEADRLFGEACEKYEAALKIKRDFHEALHNWGATLFEQAKTKKGEEADRLFSEAYEKYEAALKIKGDKHEALYNWGNALFEQAKTKEGEEADRLFGEACEKYEAALKIKRDFHEALSNWGVALSEEAKTKKGEEADRLFGEAYEKYEAALKIEGGFPRPLYNWGVALFDQAKTKEGVEADRLFGEAYEKYEAALKIEPENVGALYNLACLHALRNEVESCVNRLKVWSLADPSASRATIDDDSDFDRVRNDPRIVSFLKSLGDGEKEST